MNDYLVGSGSRKRAAWARGKRHGELGAGTCVRRVAAMAYGSCQDAESAPTPAGTMTVISWLEEFHYSCAHSGYERYPAGREMLW